MMRFLLLLFILLSSKSYSQDTTANKFISGRIAATTYTAYQKGKLWGIKNASGKIITKAQYLHLQTLPNGLFIVGDTKFGVIDASNTWIIPKSYAQINYISPTLLGVYNGTAWGVITIDNKEILSFAYGAVSKVNDNFGVACIFAGSHDLNTGVPRLAVTTDYFIFNANGLIDNIRYTYTTVKEGMAAYHENKPGAAIPPPLRFSEGLVPVNVKEGYSVFIDDKGNTAFNGRRFASGAAHPFKYGFALVGIIQEPKNPPTLDTHLHPKIAYGVIDRAGKQVVPFDYNHIQIHEDIFIIIKDFKGGLADTEGNIILAPLYDDMQLYSNGTLGVKLGYEKFIIDKTGKRLQ